MSDDMKGREWEMRGEKRGWRGGLDRAKDFGGRRDGCARMFGKGVNLVYLGAWGKSVT